MSKETHEEFMNRVARASRRPEVRERVLKAMKCQCDGKDKKCRYCQGCKSKEDTMVDFLPGDTINTETGEITHDALSEENDQ